MRIRSLRKQHRKTNNSSYILSLANILFTKEVFCEVFYMRTKHKRPTGSTGELSFPLILKRCLFSIPFFCIISLVCVCITSLIFYNTQDPTSKIDLCGVLSLYLSTAITSILVAKKIKGNEILGGLILGIYIFIFTYLISLLIGDNEGGLMPVILRAGVILISVISSLLTKKRSKPKVRRKRHV